MNRILLTICCVISACAAYANMGKDKIKETDEVKAKVESLLVSDTSSRTLDVDGYTVKIREISLMEAKKRFREPDLEPGIYVQMSIVEKNRRRSLGGGVFFILYKTAPLVYVSSFRTR